MVRVLKDSVYAKPSLILVSNKESGEIYLFDCKEYAETFGYYYSDVKAYWDNAISNDNSWLGFDYFLWESSDFESRLDQTIVDKLIEYFGADEVSVFSDAPLTSVNSIKNNLYVGSNPDPLSPSMDYYNFNWVQRNLPTGGVTLDNSTTALVKRRKHYLNRF